LENIRLFAAEEWLMNSVIDKIFTSTQQAMLNRLAHGVNRLGINLAVCDSRGEYIFQAQAGRFASDTRACEELTRKAFESPFTGIRCDGQDNQYLTCLLRQNGQPVVVVILDKGLSSQILAGNLHEYCTRHGLQERELIALLTEDTQPESYLVGLLEAFITEFETSFRHAGQIDKLTHELSQMYEQIVLLYNLSTHMKVTQSNAEFLQYACDQVYSLINAEGLAVFLEKKIDGQKRLVLTAGCGYISIDATLADIVQVHLTESLAAGKEAFLDGGVHGPFQYSWPANVKNVLAVPLQGGETMIGIMIVTNPLAKTDFDSTDVKLLNSVANECAVFIENGRLFSDLKGLFIGSLKSLTGSIDAKDPYTRGHSERVAFISRWIAEHLAQVRDIPPNMIHQVYLAGLLHDIGKIGVAEVVLRKRGKLDDQEREIIAAHPRVGSAILAEIPQMQAIIPGVLHHHERYDGKGYPLGLAGENISLLGRIVALADSFDAMTSKRVYRDALGFKNAQSEIRKGIGMQFDPQIAQVFLDSDIDKLWRIIQDGFIENWDYSNFSEYGTQAVGVLIR
jgi:HD-GYP domain-containing protein (c-di-GMP phosphodiesterase class II)